MSKQTTNDERILLATVTGEPFQPVRLYYDVPNKTAVTKAFAALRCLDEDRAARCWVWLYDDEARGLTFGKPREALSPEVHPIVIGRFRFPDKHRMVLEVRSAPRAIEAAKFFGRRLPPGVVLSRFRIINRWFEGAEAAGGLERLDKLLDAKVTRIDPKEAEAALELALSGAHTDKEKMDALAAHTAATRRKHAPLVEDFPLHPEEETEDFSDLTTTLHFRTVLAHEHWKGNTHLTLTDVILRVVDG